MSVQNYFLPSSSNRANCKQIEVCVINWDRTALCYTAKSNTKTNMLSQLLMERRSGGPSSSRPVANRSRKATTLITSLTKQLNPSASRANRGGTDILKRGGDLHRKIGHRPGTAGKKRTAKLIHRNGGNSTLPTADAFSDIGMKGLGISKSTGSSSFMPVSVALPSVCLFVVLCVCVLCVCMKMTVMY